MLMASAKVSNVCIVNGKKKKNTCKYNNAVLLEKLVAKVQVREQFTICNFTFHRSALETTGAADIYCDHAVVGHCFC